MRRRLPGRPLRRAPLPVSALILALAAVAVCVAAWSGRSGPGAEPVGALAVAGLLVALVAAAYLHVEYRHRDDVNALDLFEAAIAPTLLLLPGAEAIALVAVAKVVSEALLRVQAVKAAFNVVSWAASAGAGAVVLDLAGASRPGGGGDLPALVAAMVAVAVVNEVAYVTVLRLAQRRTFRDVLEELRPAIVPAWLVGGAVTLSFGVLFAAACAWEPHLGWLLPVPLAALHWASQSYAASRAELARAEGLHRATRALTGAESPLQVIPAYLEEVRRSLDADAVDLVADHGGRVRVHRAAGEGGAAAVAVDHDLAAALVAIGAPERLTALCPDPLVRAGLRAHGWRDCLVAQVPTSGETRRALCVFDPKGLMTLGAADLAVVERVAGELGGALARAEAQSSLAASEARFRALVGHSSDLVVVLDAAGTITDVLPSTTSPTLRFTEGIPVASLAHPEDVPALEQCLARVAATPASTSALTWRVATVNGSWRHVETKATNLLDDPDVGGVVMNSRDVTERERAAQLVAGQAEVLGSISGRSPLDETVEALAAAVEAQAHRSRCTVVLVAGRGGSTTVLGSPLPRPLVDELIDALGSVGECPGDGDGRSVVVGDVASDQRWARAASGSDVRAVWATPIEPADGAWQRGLAVLHFDHPRTPDASDRRVLASAADLASIAVEAVASQARLVHQATHDPLTGLPNRLLFLDRAAVALARLSRSGMSVAVLFVDLDRFKMVNDSLGHEVGDRLLVTLSDRLKAAMRPSDTVARFGGDEFTILCEDIRDQREAVAIAARVRHALAAPVPLEGHDLYVTASIGIAHTADHRRLPQELVEDADTAMYRAKRAGGDVQVVYDASVRDQALLDLVTYENLRKAVEREELVVHFQPAVDLRTGRVVGAEALVRWEGEHGLMGPHDFIPLAEETGLIVPLGTVVLNRACEQRRGWADDVDEGFTMSVNLSPRQFADPGLLAVVDDALAGSGVSPASLTLEITESTLMEDAEATMVVLHALKDLGVRLAIDDFGTGYSSLSYLKRFPVDVLKVDKTFVDGLGADPGDEAIVRAVVELAHTFGMTSVAEGVETDEQVRRLLDLGCDVAQGFRFSPPVPADQVRFAPRDLDLDLREPVANVDLPVGRRGGRRW